MKNIRKLIISFLVLLLVFALFTDDLVRVAAHSTILDIHYDACSGQDNDDEAWYRIKDIVYEHIDEEVTTLKYYFESSHPDNSEYTWTTDVSESVANHYLKANGTAGVVTYGYVVRLTLGYYRNNP